MTKTILETRNLSVEAQGVRILDGINIEFMENQVAAILGPNASGKSMLAKSIIGLSEYEVTAGDIIFEGESILDKAIDERARLGIGYAFQKPPLISGVRFQDFICRVCPSYVNKDVDTTLMSERCMLCTQELYNDFDRLGIRNLALRDLNDGFSGGEIKRSEIFQVLSMRPKIMILDEPDSGLDYDSLKMVGRELRAIKDRGNTTLVIISHHRYILEFLQVDTVYILNKGQLVYTGDMSDIPVLEEKGYDKFLTKVAQ
jgi:Fe-S cluster assembly ATP-binding protein